MASPASHHVHRLSRWQRLALDLTGALLLLSGAGWLVVHYGIGASAGELPHPLEAWSLRLHGLAAFAGLFVLGVLAAAHFPMGWHPSHRPLRAGQRNSGVLLCVAGGLLTASGYLLFYFATDAVRPVLGLAHAFIGAAMGLLIAIHRRAGRPSLTWIKSAARARDTK